MKILKMKCCFTILLAFFALPLQSKADIMHFRQVTNGIYRGGRPSPDDIAALHARLGVKSVINLENKTGEIALEKEATDQLGMAYLSAPMSALRYPNDAEIVQILKALQSADHQPIFIHCHHGQDRSGLIIGLYRVFVQHWSPAQAYHEMLAMGFHPELKPLDDYFKRKTGYSGQ